MKTLCIMISRTTRLSITTSSMRLRIMALRNMTINMPKKLFYIVWQM